MVLSKPKLLPRAMCGSLALPHPRSASMSVEPPKAVQMTKVWANNEATLMPDGHSAIKAIQIQIRVECGATSVAMVASGP